MISWIHSLLYLREGRSDPLENSDNCFYLIFIKPHSRIIWWLFFLLHSSSLWHFKICFPKRKNLLSQRFNSRIFAERKLGALFEVCFDFKDLGNIDIYLLLSLLPLFKRAGSLPSPSQQPVLWFIGCASGAGRAGTAPACWGEAVQGTLFLPCCGCHIADSGSGQTAASSSFRR